MKQAYVNAYSHLRQFDGRFATVPVTDQVNCCTFSSTSVPSVTNEGCGYVTE